MLQAFNKEISDKDLLCQLKKAKDEAPDAATKEASTRRYSEVKMHYKMLKKEKLLSEAGTVLHRPLILRTESKTRAHNGHHKPPRAGRLMQICLTPATFTDRSFNNLNGVPPLVFKHVPNAVCLVVTGRGVPYQCYLVVFWPERTTSPLAGVFVKVSLCSGYEVPAAKQCAPVCGPKGGKGSDSSKIIQYTIGQVIETVDKEFGLDVPVVVIGYTCLIRCVSVRSKHRVITHAILMARKGQHMGNMQVN